MIEASVAIDVMRMAAWRRNPCIDGLPALSQDDQIVGESAL
jgi:hypothetical protein